MLNAKARLRESSELNAAPRYPKTAEFIERAIRNAEPDMAPRRFSVQNKEVYQDVYDELGDSRIKVVEQVLTTVNDPHVIIQMLRCKTVGSRTLDSFAIAVGKAVGALDEMSQPATL